MQILQGLQSAEGIAQTSGKYQVFRRQIRIVDPELFGFVRLFVKSAGDSIIKKTVQYHCVRKQMLS
jgi:hypothetical protein